MLHFKHKDAQVIFEYVVENCPVNSTILDIGCRKGKWISPFVTHLPTATFHCFEALPEHFEKANSRFRKHDNVFVHQTVVSDRNDNVVFYRDKERAGWSGLKQHSYMNDFDKLNLTSTTIDSYNLKPYFIKIDVEGAELLALQGAQQTIQHTQIIYFECNEIHFKEYNYTANDLFEFLDNNNFCIQTTSFKKLSKEEFEYTTKDERRFETPKTHHSNFIAVKNV